MEAFCAEREREREREREMEFPELGTRCAFAECRQLSFIHFKCSGCSRHFCMEHRMPEAHRCATPPMRHEDTRVVVCPICAKGVRVPEGADADVEWARHAARPGECDPSNWERVNKYGEDTLHHHHVLVMEVHFVKTRCVCE